MEIPMAKLTPAQVQCLRAFVEHGFYAGNLRTTMSLVRKGLLQVAGHEWHGYRKFTAYEISPAGLAALGASQLH